MKKLLLSLVAVATALTSVAQVSFYVNPPSTNSGNYSIEFADNAGGDWSMPDLTDPANAVEDTLVIVQGVDSLGCDPLTNGTDVNGQIALVWRGECEFGTKALNAQNAGAIAIVIVNHSGEPVGMAGGTDGINVTIPVVMISTSTGNLLYDEIMGGGDVTAFIGNKFGYFNDDIGINQKDVLRAKQFALPIALAADDTEFDVPLGGFVFNFGSNDQTNITLNVTITNGSGVVYDETSAAVPSLVSGDSIWIAMPTFSQTTYTEDYYSVVYSIDMDATDEFIDDDELNADFMLTEDEFSYATVDQATLKPNAYQFSQLADFTGTWGECIHFTNENAGRKIAMGLTFSATSSNGTSLEDTYITIDGSEWTDAITDANDPGYAGITLLNTVASGEFTYTTDSQNVNIYVPFVNSQGNPAPLQMVDGGHYIFCVNSNNEDAFLGFDNSIDYDENMFGSSDGINITHGNGLVSSVVSDDGAIGGSVGFGTDMSSSIMLHTKPVEELSVNDTEISLEKAYPNPAIHSINIPLNGLSGVGTLNIVDVAGKIVSSQQVNLSNSTLVVDVTKVPAGMYVFNLNTENGKSTSFNVLVGK